MCGSKRVGELIIVEVDIMRHKFSLSSEVKKEEAIMLSGKPIKTEFFTLESNVFFCLSLGIKARARQPKGCR